MRRLHRWIIAVFCLMFVYWAGSGLTLAIWDVTDSSQGWSDGGGPGLRPTPVTSAASLDLSQIAPGLAKALQMARAAAPDTKVNSVALRATAAGAQGVVDVAGRQPRTLVFDLRSRRLISSHPDAAPGSPTPMPQVRGREAIHNEIKNWHRGNIVGSWGVAVTMLVGIGLILTLLSGTILYFNLWLSRRRVNANGFFWRGSAGATAWRTLHRCIAIVAAAYLMNMAITGTLLAWDEFSLRAFGAGPGAPLPKPVALPAAFDAESVATEFFRQAHARAPDAPMTALMLSMKANHVEGTATFGGPYPGQIAIDTVTKERLPGPPGPATPKARIDYHQLLKRLHRGDFIGSFYGRFMSIATGLCFLFLSVSGIVMYAQLLLQRRHLGRSGLFW